MAITTRNHDSAMSLTYHVIWRASYWSETKKVRFLDIGRGAFMELFPDGLPNRLRNIRLNADVIGREG